MGCCSGTDFTPAADAAPDASQRVNYSFGMVLGVDDFLQEHAWLAGRDQRALRETIGYGVLAGLAVGVDHDGVDAVAEPGAVQLRVAPGLALAPDGRLVAVPGAQCARLDKWLAGAGRQTPVVAGARVAHVVLAFHDQSSTPVPIPGEPCRDESAQQADARWTDSFSLALCWDAPSTTEDDALRELCAWLHALPVHDAPVNGVSVDEFTAAVQDLIGAQLASPWAALAAAPAKTAAGKALVLPRAGYTDYLAAAFGVWTRQLRLRHLAKHGPVPGGDGSHGVAETGLPLAQVHFTLDASGLLADPAAVQVRDTGLPQLLHQRLLQEWLLSAPENDAPHDARYVLGRADPRLGRAQDLLATFFPKALRAAERAALAEAPGHGPMARVDRAVGVGRNDDSAQLAPALKYAGQPGADYYGPQMDAPIPVADGGTGQATAPGEHQLLVGRGGVFTLADLVAKDSPAGGRNLAIEYGPDTQPDLVLDTVQPIHAQATPTFAELTLTGTRLERLSPARKSLLVSGGTETDALSIGSLGPALLAANGAHQVVAAPRWDGGPLSVHTAAFTWYGPGQTAAVRIEDGGTGLQQRPAARQLLVGRELPVNPPSDGDRAADSDYVLATLTAGQNVDITLDQDESQDWRLTINAGAVDSIALPILPTQGGTGLVTAPQDGQLLLGTAGGEWHLGRLVPGGNASLAVVPNSDGLVLDTTQALHAQAAPSFAGVKLSGIPVTAGPPVPTLQVAGGVTLHDLGSGDPVALLGQRADGQVVSSSVLPLPMLRKLLVLDDRSGFPPPLFKFSVHDWVLVYAGQKNIDGGVLPDPLREGQILMIKVMPGANAGTVTITGDGPTGSLDLGLQATLALKPGVGITLVGCVKALDKPTWLVQSRG